jgi:tRNA nucleotidyltransferase (CCA-adding enzyme)
MAISTVVLFTAEDITKNNSVTSSIINLTNLPANSSLALDVTVVGSGSAKGEYLIGDTDTDTFFTPSGASDIFTNQTVGRDRYSFTPIISEKMQIKITEENVNDIAVTVKLIIKSLESN